jgi:hypothetical protein
MYSSYRSRLLRILDVIFEACSLWEQRAPVDGKIGACVIIHHVKQSFDMGFAGLNTLQIIEQCEKAVSKLTACVVVNENYLQKKKTDYSRNDYKRLVFLEVIAATKHTTSALQQGFA